MEFSLGKIRRPAARRRAGNATRIFSLIFLITLSFETFNSQTFFSSCVPQVMQSNDLKVDESSLTGESDQVEMLFLKKIRKECKLFCIVFVCYNTNEQ